jgi:nucleoside-diphosphate-sugar epimerase
LRILVTGAGGHLGLNILASSLFRDDHIYAVVRNLLKIPYTIRQQKHISFFEVDLLSKDDVKKNLAPLEIDAIVHFAWSGITAASRDLVQQNDNIQIIQNILLAVQDKSFRYFLALGSRAECGSRTAEIRHDSAFDPDCHYGHAKLAVYDLLRNFCLLQNVKLCWLRLVATYGPYDNPEHLIPYIIMSLKRKQLPLINNPRNEWDYLFSEDAMAAIFDLLKNETPGVFSLGSGQTALVSDIAEAIFTLMGEKFKPYPISLGETMVLRGDYSALEKAVGWQPKFSLQEGLRKTIMWNKNNMSHL